MNTIVRKISPGRYSLVRAEIVAHLPLSVLLVGCLAYMLLRLSMGFPAAASPYAHQGLDVLGLRALGALPLGMLLGGFFAAIGVLGGALCGTHDFENNTWTMVRSLPLTLRRVWLLKATGSLIACMSMSLIGVAGYIFLAGKADATDFFTSAGAGTRAMGIGLAGWALALVIGAWQKTLVRTVAGVVLALVALYVVSVFAGGKGMMNTLGVVGALGVPVALIVLLKWMGSMQRTQLAALDAKTGKVAVRRVVAPSRMGFFLLELKRLRVEMVMLMLVPFIGGYGFMLFGGKQGAMQFAMYMSPLLMALYLGVMLVSTAELEPLRSPLTQIPAARWRLLLARLSASLVVLALPLVYHYWMFGGKSLLIDPVGSDPVAIFAVTNQPGNILMFMTLCLFTATQTVLSGSRVVGGGLALLAFPVFIAMFGPIAIYGRFVQVVPVFVLALVVLLVSFDRWRLRAESGPVWRGVDALCMTIVMYTVAAFVLYVPLRLIVAWIL